MYTLVYLKIHERTKMSSHNDYSMEQHPPQGGWKQQQNNDTTNLVSQFINEKISVAIRIRLEMDAMSHPQEEQYSSHLSLPYDFKIQCNQYHLSPKMSKADLHEVNI